LRRCAISGSSIVDEEHEPAYKQDETPRYHGRDVAVMRAKLAGAVACWARRRRRWRASPTSRRASTGCSSSRSGSTPGKLPYIEIVDLRIEAAKQRSLPALSGKLVRAMQDRLEKREQTILFINRRGYSSSMLCKQCGHVEQCTHCSIALTFHRTDETLRCHLCGDQRAGPDALPAMRGTGHPLARARHPARRGGGAARAAAGANRADGYRHDGEEEPLPRSAGGVSPGGSTSSWARR
jgi:primosomal protein N'